MKYIYLTIRTRCGEFEFRQNQVKEINGDIETNLREYVKNYYNIEELTEKDKEYKKEIGNSIGELWDGFDQDVYFFFSGQLAVKIDSWKEIPESDYKILNNYL